MAGTGQPASESTKARGSISSDPRRVRWSRSLSPASSAVLRWRRRPGLPWERLWMRR